MLAIDLGEMDHLTRCRVQDFGVEEVGAGVVGRKQYLFLGRHHRWELIEIANENHLDAAEGFPGTRTIEAQKLIDAIEEIGTDHTDLVDHDGL